MKKLLEIFLKNRERILSISFNEIKKRYVGSFLGILWTILEPLSIILVYSLIFPLLLGVSFTEWVIFFIVGLIPYRFLRKGSLEVVRSLSEYRNILEKMKIEKEEIILARALSNFIYFLIEIMIFFPVIIFLRSFSLTIIFLPVLFLSLVFLVLGFGFLFSLECLKYKDVEYILNIFFELLFFLSPIVYRIERAPEALRNFLILLPSSSIIYSFHSIFFQNLKGFKQIYPLHLLLIYSLLFSLSFLALSYKLFIEKKYEE